MAGAYSCAPPSLVPELRLPRPSWSIRFGDVSETKIARTTSPETHRPRGMMRPKDKGLLEKDNS